MWAGLKYSRVIEVLPRRWAHLCLVKLRWLGKDHELCQPAMKREFHIIGHSKNRLGVSPHFHNGIMLGCASDYFSDVIETSREQCWACFVE
jgi:hypothetical protein